MKDESPIFIVGMPRSGTTLLRSLLNQHPLIAIAPETHFLTMYQGNSKSPESCLQEYLSSERFRYFGIKQENVYLRLKKEACLSYKKVFDALIKEYALYVNKPIFGEKTPGHYEHLTTFFQWYPEARVLWIIRDPRAVAASYQHVPWHKGGVTGPAIRWRSSIKELQKWKKDGRVFVLKYEDLIMSPQLSIDAICDFLNVDSIPKTRLETNRDDPSLNHHKGWEHEHLKSSAKSISTRPLTKWKAELTSKQIAIIESLTSRGMEEMNYKKEYNKSFFQYINTYISVAHLLSQQPNIIIHKILNLKRIIK